MKTYDALADEARFLIQKQLRRLGEKLKTEPLTPEAARALLQLARWLSEMAMVEKDDLEQMSDDDRRNYIKNLAQRSRRFQKLYDPTEETGGDPEEESAEDSGQSNPN